LSLSPFWHPPRDQQDRCSFCKRDCSKRFWKAGEENNSDVNSTKSKSNSTLGTLLEGALSKGSKR
jgi:hypothetical protein